MKTGSTEPSKGQKLIKVGQCLYRSNVTNLYYALLKRQGKQIKKSLRTKDYALAKRKLRDLESKVARLNPTESGKAVFDSFAKQWLVGACMSLKPSSAQRLDVVVRSLAKYFGASMVRNITEAHVTSWGSDRSKKCEARTFNTERATLSRIMETAIRQGIILENPVTELKRIKPSKPQIIIPTKDEFRKLIQAIRNSKVDAHHSANLCEFLGLSGCRLGEAIPMVWQDIDFVGEKFVVKGGEFGTKNHEDRTVPLFPSLKQFLISMRDSLPSPPSSSDRLFPIKSARTPMKSACKKEHLRDFTHHELRHFFCSNAIEAGIDFKAISGWLGHKDGGVLVARTYGHLREEHSANMAKKMTFGLAQPQEAGQ